MTKFDSEYTSVQVYPRARVTPYDPIYQITGSLTLERFNRDEFYARENAPLEWHDSLLGGWDMAPGREYGSWLTISRTGRVGILTNVLVPRPDPNGLARGKLVTDFASSSFSPEDYFDTLALDQFNEFNLSAIDLLTKDGKTYFYL